MLEFSPSSVGNLNFASATQSGLISKTITNYVITLCHLLRRCSLKWTSPMANNYYVFATPTMFLLSKKRELVLRPMSVGQVDAWVDCFLK